MRASTSARLLLGGVLLTLSIAAKAENALTTDTASVRAGPDGSYPEVAQLDAGTPVQVMGCLDDWSWCDVAFEDMRGWLYSTDINYEYEGGYVPFYAYAPAFGLPVLSFSVDAYWGRYYHDRPWYGQREEWVHRTVRHQRPPGPAPSHSAPPRQVVRTDRPHGGSEPMHLGRAQESHPQEHRDSAASRFDARAPEHRAPEPREPEPRAQERASEPRAAEPHAQQHMPPPAQPSARAPKPPEHAEAPPHEPHRQMMEKPNAAPAPMKEEHEDHDHPR
jgi:uncharacterized protein YraI